MEKRTNIILSTIAALVSICLIAPLFLLYWHSVGNIITQSDIEQNMRVQKLESKIEKNKRVQVKAMTRVYEEQLSMLKEQLGTTENVIKYLNK